MNKLNCGENNINNTDNKNILLNYSIETNYKTVINRKRNKTFTDIKSPINKSKLN